MMELIVNGETLPEPVTNELISEAIHSLSGDGDSFAILAKGPQVYIQTAGGPNEGFVLEYRDGSEAEHYSCTTSSLGADNVVRAFQSYLADDDRWKTNLNWEPHDFGYSQGSGNSNAVFLVVGLVIVALVLWKIFS